MWIKALLGSRRNCSVLLSVIATVLYLNTLPAGFTFDDNFAVVCPVQELRVPWLLHACAHIECIPAQSTLYYRCRGLHQVTLSLAST